MKKPAIYRRRFIPDETVDISSDELLYRSGDLLVTRWKAIKPRSDISGGLSYAYLNEGYKISRFFDAEGKFIYWYCDIVEVLYDREKDSYTFNDLLLDIKVMPDGSTKLLDADELAEALEKGLITPRQAGMALRSADKLLKNIYSGNFPPKECENHC